MVRRIIGAGLLVFGLWLFWLPLEAALIYANRGAPVGSVASDPVFLIPGLRGLLAIIAGALTLFGLGRGAILAGVAALFSFALGGLIMAAGADGTLWRPHFIYGASLVVFTAALVFVRRAANAT